MSFLVSGFWVCFFLSIFMMDVSNLQAQTKSTEWSNFDFSLNKYSAAESDIQLVKFVLSKQPWQPPQY